MKNTKESQSWNKASFPLVFIPERQMNKKEAPFQNYETKCANFQKKFQK